MSWKSRNLVAALSRAGHQIRAGRPDGRCFKHHNHRTPLPLERRSLHAIQTRTQHTSGSDPTEPSDQSAREPLSFPDPRDPRQHPLANLSIEQVLEDTETLARKKVQQQQPVYRRKLTETGEAFAIGRRKCSQAKIWLREGNGVITVNDQSWVDYFPRVDHRDKILRPLDLLGVTGRFDVKCRVFGGGINGQTEAVRHGIARALQNWDPHMRPSLKQDGLLTRDSRIVEPKKYGRKKARKSFTWVKR